MSMDSRARDRMYISIFKSMFKLKVIHHLHVRSTPTIYLQSPSLYLKPLSRGKKKNSLYYIYDIHNL